ncbi:phage tail domain-containing protein [Actinomadura decatromicini]|uniref:Phage tail protein n=1 Tax=Actinomadura decatromicini TaxID=2604572 RepID=A0A5D3FAP9_9ACTN|nr:phage tail domain-containing protein [Actinomadura decatromicini]TYK45152.1 phage tail protein [Actinomadura decatromicini]
MPLLAQPGTVQPPVQIPGVGFATARFVEANGTIWPLTSPTSGWFTLSEGVSGLGAAPYELAKDDHPRGGSRLRSSRPNDKTIVWPMHVFGKDHLQFVARWRALAEAFTRTLRIGAGWLEITRPDGSRRRIACYYEDGFEGQGRQGTGVASDSVILSLYCEDPYWIDPVPVTGYRAYSVGVPFLNPFPTVSSGQVLGATTLTNPGGVEAWPTWVVTGPASLVTFTNEDTGESFAFNPDATAIGHGDLLAGEKVTITTNPPRVTFQDGSNWIGGLDWPGAVLWALPPGESAITFQLDGAGPGSRVDLSYNARYETA